MQWTEIPREEMRIPGDPKNLGVTPYFRYESIFNEPQSKIQGKEVRELKEVVEIRFAANSNYKPVFGVDEMAATDPDTGRIITWAERYKAQYQAFLAGSEQEADGTPLEELLPFGISQAQLSLCRALNIYSIEALAHIEGPGRKRLGVHSNDLIPMAKRFLESRRTGASQQSEINELKRQIAAMQAQTVVADPFSEPDNIQLSTAIPETVPALPEGYESMTDVQLKDEIEKLTQARPRGNPSRATLVGLLDQALAA